MNRFPLLFAGVFLSGILMAFPPAAAGQMTEKVLHRFGGNTSGAISNVAGNYTNLVVYSTFLGPSGGVPEGGLIMDSAGNLYGTTYSGGNFTFGVVFKTNMSGTNYTALYNFAGPSGDGANPRATLVMDAAGNLYGTTQTYFRTAA